MRTLQVPLYSFWTKHSAIEWEFLPRLEANDFVVFYLELDAALLTAETAVRLNETICFNAAVQSLTAGESQVWPKGFNDGG